MARMQSSGPSPSYAWPSVIFAIVSVILLIVAIVLYEQLGDAQQKADKAQSNLQTYVTKAQQNSSRVKKYLSSDTSVVGQLLKNNDQLKKFIGVNKDADIKAISKKLSDAHVDSNLLGKVGELQTNISSLNSQIEKIKQARKEADAKQKQYAKRNAQLSKQYEKASKKLQATIDSRKNQLSSLQKQIDKLKKHAQDQVSDNKNQFAKQVSTLETEKNSVAKKADALDKKISQMVTQTKEKGKTFATADGHISTVFTSQDKVSIDRGSYDHILLGMTFEVYPNKQDVEVSGKNNKRGVATIQVTKVNNHSSLARVVRKSHSKVVTAGDKIINLVYSPDKTYTFVVSGKFDIDNSGKSTDQARNRVESMIHQWGGKIDVSLNYNVDFLVLGTPPSKPEKLSSDVVDADLIAKHAAAEKRYKHHEQMLKTAQKLSIPVVNQNRFLTLIGYYQRP